MVELIDPAPTVDFESITFRCSCGEVISGAWDEANVCETACTTCHTDYYVSAMVSVDVVVEIGDGLDYCSASY